MRVRFRERWRKTGLGLEKIPDQTGVAGSPVWLRPGCCRLPAVFDRGPDPPIPWTFLGGRGIRSLSSEATGGVCREVYHRAPP